MMNRAEALRKCLIVFDALKRVSSKGNAGLEPMPGAEESFRTDSEICQVLREWLREMESGAHAIRGIMLTKEQSEEMERRFRAEIEMPRATDQLEYILQGNPLFTEETIEAARRMDEARDRMIEKYASKGLQVPNGPLEPDVPKVVELKEWQRLKKPPERLDFDEDS